MTTAMSPQSYIYQRIVSYDHGDVWEILALRDYSVMTPVRSPLVWLIDV